MPLEIRRHGFPQMLRIEAVAARDHDPGAVFNAPPQKIGTVGQRPKRTVILKLLQHRPRKPEFRCQQTVKAYAGLKRNREIDLRHGPVGRFIPYLFRDIEFGKLVDALRFTSQGFEIECLRPYPLWIVGLQRFENRRAYVPDILALKNRPVPALVADYASIDKLGIQLAAIGIEPDLAAGLKCPQAAASAACKPGLGRRSWRNGPLDPK